MSRPLKTIARLRVPLGFVCGVVVLWLADPTPRTLAMGAVVAILGEAIRIWAAGHLEKGREVTMSGPYRLTRHPLYAGSTLIGVGLAIAGADLVVATIVIAYLGVTLTAAIRTEEAHLTEKFGAAYPDYRAGHPPGAGHTSGAGRTPRARAPRAGRIPGAHRRFSLERAMRNGEYRAAIGVVVVLAVLWWKVQTG